MSKNWDDNLTRNWSIEHKSWLLECPIVFYLIWPNDLVYDPRWPKLKLVQDFIKTKILTIFLDNWGKNMAPRVSTNISFIWHSVLLYDPADPNYNSFTVSSRQKFGQIFKSIERFMWPLENKQGISLIWPSDLVYDPRWLKLIQGFIKTSILTNFKVSWARNVASKGLVRNFFLIWPSDLVFDPRGLKFKLVRVFIKTGLLTNFQVKWARIVALERP